MSIASPATKTTHEQQLMRLMRKRKLLRARDVAEQGLPTITLTRLVQADKLERVARGVYGLPGAATSIASIEAQSLSGLACRMCVTLASALWLEPASRCSNSSTGTPLEHTNEGG